MPTPPKGPRLGGSPAHERLILANLARSLFEHGKITTTETKAKRLRPVAEKLITAAKRGSLHSRREVLKTVRDKNVVHKLFAEIGPSFATREGGYTRITKTLPRKGDNAPMAVIELIGEETVTSAASRVARTAASRKAVKKSSAPATGTSAAATGAAEAADTAPAAVTESESAEAAVTESESAEAAVTESETAEAAVTDTPATQALDAGLAADADDAADAPADAADAPADAADAPADAADAPADGADAPIAEVEESASTPDAPYGEGSHAPLEDGAQPEGFPIKGNSDSMLYHVPGSSHYAQTVAEVWFATAEDAEAAGFSLPPSQRAAAGADADEPTES